MSCDCRRSRLTSADEGARRRHVVALARHLERRPSGDQLAEGLVDRAPRHARRLRRPRIRSSVRRGEQGEVSLGLVPRQARLPQQLEGPVGRHRRHDSWRHRRASRARRVAARRGRALGRGWLDERRLNLLTGRGYACRAMETSGGPAGTNRRYWSPAGPTARCRHRPPRRRPRLPRSIVDVQPADWIGPRSDIRRPRVASVNDELAIEEVFEEFGAPDVVVNNAGIVASPRSPRRGSRTSAPSSTSIWSARSSSLGPRRDGGSTPDDRGTSSTSRR